MSKTIYKPTKSTHARNSNNKNGTTYRFQAMNQDKIIDEIFPSCSAIVKKYGEEFHFNRDVLYRLRKKQYKTDYNCYANDKYKNIRITDILFGDTPEGCDKLIERKQNLEKIHAILEESKHLGEILSLLQTLENKD